MPNNSGSSHEIHNSYRMSKIRSKNTKPELKVRKFLHGIGFRYKLHVSDLPGTPDLVFPKYRTVLFINGCFWHGHENCPNAKVPKTRTKWWIDKITRNASNDTKNCKMLEALGYNVVILWECKIYDESYQKWIACKISKDNSYFNT